MPEPAAAPPPTELPIVVTHIDALKALDVALTEAIAAWDAREELRHAETRWLAAQRALEAAWQRTGLRGAWTSVEIELPNGEVSEPGQDMTASIPEPADDAPATLVRPAAGGGPGPIVTVPPEREAIVLREIVRAGSVASAAKALGLSDARVRQYVKRAKDEGRLPAEVAALIRSRS